MSTAEDSLRICRLFEAELLLELMLRWWEHPLCKDEDFRRGLLDDACEVLNKSVNGIRFLDDLDPSDMNLVAAIWYVESSVIGVPAEDKDGKRKAWLERVRHSLPSCFCSPDDLP